MERRPHRVGGGRHGAGNGPVRMPQTHHQGGECKRIAHRFTRRLFVNALMAAQRMIFLGENPGQRRLSRVDNGKAARIGPVIYKQRLEMMDAEEVSETVTGMRQDVLADLVAANRILLAEIRSRLLVAELVKSGENTPTAIIRGAKKK